MSSTPSGKVSKSALSGKRRARMGTEKTPENPKPVHRKRKPSTRARTLKDMLNVMDVNQDTSAQLLKSPEDKKRKLDESIISSELVGHDASKIEGKVSSETCIIQDAQEKENTTSQDDAFVVASKQSNLTSDNTKGWFLFTNRTTRALGLPQINRLFGAQR